MNNENDSLKPKTESENKADIKTTESESQLSFFDYVKQWVDGTPHTHDGLTKISVKRDIPEDALKLLEVLAFNPAYHIRHQPGMRDFFVQEEPKISDEDDYSIEDSKTSIGYLYPILEDAFGNLIDGAHRLKTDPTGPRRRLMNINTPEKLELARLHANYFRRNSHDNVKENKERVNTLANLDFFSPQT